MTSSIEAAERSRRFSNDPHLRFWWHHLHGTDYVVGWTAWLDLAPMGVNKASGLQLVAQELGIDAADVLAIGDGRNDIEMLQWAGRGVAMGQAIEVVREAADAVTGAVHEEGAAAELSRWFP